MVEAGRCKGGRGGSECLPFLQQMMYTQTVDGESHVYILVWQRSYYCLLRRGSSVVASAYSYSEQLQLQWGVDVSHVGRIPGIGVFNRTAARRKSAIKELRHDRPAAYRVIESKQIMCRLSFFDGR